VGLYRPGRDRQRLPDLAVGHPIGEQPEDLLLARTERIEAGRPALHRTRPGALDEVAHRSCRELAGHRQVPVAHAPDGPQQRIRIEVLGQVADGPQPNRLEHIGLRGRHGQHHELAVGEPRPEFAQEAQAVHPGQVDIDENDVGPEFGRDPQRLLGAGRLADDVDVGRRQRLADRGAYEPVVVNEQDPQDRSHARAASSVVTSTVIRVPSWGRDQISNDAPTSSARSRIPRRP
jgi:hypothetical protein